MIMERGGTLKTVPERKSKIKIEDDPKWSSNISSGSMWGPPLSRLELLAFPESLLA
jgi:hypothetical protein